MRSLVLFIALLASGKFGYQEYVYRSALADALINTYRQDAVVSCQKEASVRNLAIAYSAWMNPESFKLIVGHGSHEASAADLSLESGAAASPYLVIVARKAPAQVTCEFDIVRMSAAVYQM